MIDDDELFVVSHENPIGAPVLLKLREMTAADVLDALEWHDAELRRLWDANKPHAEILERATEPLDAIARTAFWESRALLTKIRAQIQISDRLLQAVIATRPEQFRHLPLRDTIGLWWPNH